MQVFKAYFKIMRKHIKPMILYFVIFVGLSLIITNAIGGGGAGYMQTKSRIALFNDDAGQALSDGLEKYIAENSEVVMVRDNAQSIQDALFYGNISCALRIPEGFTEAFLAGNADVMLEKTAGPSEADSVQMDLLANRYLNIAGIYAANGQGMDAAQIAANVSVDLEASAELRMEDSNGLQQVDFMTYCFQYLAYPIMGIIIMGITSFMMAMNREDIINRNMCSPLRLFKMNMQIILGNVVFAVVVWAALCAIVLSFCDGVPNIPAVVLLCLNVLALVIVSLSIGFFAGKFIKNFGAQNALVNIVALGSCFLCGVFVEQSLLGSTVLSVARFLPAYWYVKAINDIRGIASFTFSNMLPSIYSMLIQLGFAAVILIIALVLTKQKRMQKAA